MCVILFDVFNGCSVVKKLIGKGMSNIYYREKLMFSKLVGKVNFLERKFEEIAQALKSKNRLWHMRCAIAHARLFTYLKH